MYEEADREGDLLITLFPSTEAFAIEDADLSTTTNEGFTLGAAGPHLMHMDDDDDDDDDDNDGSVHEPEHLEVEVSSKYLCHAVPRFKKMLTGPWLEATTVYDDGLRRVDIEGFDADAFKIGMHVIHGNSWKVPLAVELDILGRIALVVDDLQCADMAATLWAAGLEGQFPATYGRNLIARIFISYTLQLPAACESATRTAMFDSNGPVPSLGLPIPNWVLGK
jgi:hypothetical protein